MKIHDLSSCTQMYSVSLTVALSVCRTPASPAEETQEDVHREDGSYEEPVEEHRGALRQLVSAAHDVQGGGEGVVCSPMQRALPGLISFP